MSHIQWELRAIELAGYVARASECDEDVVFGGLTRLWVYCWREKTSSVTDAALRGIFRKNVTAGLLEFGFLERTGPTTYRVKGAARYLRVQDGWSKGGHASKGNLIPGGPKGRVKGLKSPIAGIPLGQTSAEDLQPVENSSGAEHVPRLPLGSLSAPSRLDLGLTPNIEHRSSNSKESAFALAPVSDPETEPLPARVQKPRAVKPKPPPDPRHAELRERCCQVYLEEKREKFAFLPRDAKALQTLLGLADPGEIEARWRRALRRTGFPTVVNLAELVTHWGRFASGVSGLTTQRRFDPDFPQSP